MIPVMIWGRLILGKRYNMSDYLIALTVTAGCTLFLSTGEVHSSAAKKTADTTIYGAMLMGGYLGFDGFTSTFQDKLFKGYHMETYNQVRTPPRTAVVAHSACKGIGGWLVPVLEMRER